MIDSKTTRKQFAIIVSLTVLGGCERARVEAPKLPEPSWQRKYRALISNVQFAPSVMQSSKVVNFVVWPKGVVMSQAQPNARWIFWDAIPSRPAGGPTDVSDQFPMPKLGAARATLGVADSMSVLFAVGARGRLVSMNLGGIREHRGVLGSVDLQAACLLGDSSVVYLERGQPGAVFRRHIGQTGGPPDSLSIESLNKEGTLLTAQHWNEWRLSASPDGPCMMWHPRSTTFGALSLSASTNAVSMSWIASGDLRTVAQTSDSTTAVSGYAGGFFVLTALRDNLSSAQLRQYSLDGRRIAQITLPSTTIAMASGLNSVYLVESTKRGTFISRFDLNGGTSLRDPSSANVPAPPSGVVVTDTSAARR